MIDLDAYQQFLEAKAAIAPRFGVAAGPADLSPVLKPHQRAIAQWMLDGGRRACFAAFGLGKSVVQLETVRVARERAGGRGLIIMPLGVRQEFVRDAGLLDVPVQFIRRGAEARSDEPVYLTNYEAVRERNVDPRDFAAVSLDEAAILRGFGGTKTFREFMAKIAGDDRAAGVRTEGIPYRFVATATPSPNEYIELLAYAAFLGVMDVGEAKTRFFRRNSEKADQLTLHPHKTREFWLWVASWALFITKPSDICDCPCHEEARSLATGTASSSSSRGCAVHSATERGAADATVAASGSPPPPTCSRDGSSAADASDPSTGRRARRPTSHGAACSTESSATGATIAIAESAPASDGAGSPPSSPISVNRQPAAPSSASTTIEATSPATAAGRPDGSKHETLGARSGLSTAVVASHSPPGPKSSASATGPSTPATAPDGRQSGCSNGSCMRCAELDRGYELPPLDVRWHELQTHHGTAGAERDGQGRLFRNTAIGVQDAAREKRESLPARVAKAMELRAEDPAAHRLIWHDLEDERRALEDAIPGLVTIYGSQPLDAREQQVIAFSDGEISELAGKPVMLGSGCNFQRHCAWSIYLGIGFKFADFIQSIHRLYRFLQTRPVRIDLIYTEAERDVRRQLERKWRQHDEMVAKMTAIVREFGLTHAAMASTLARTLGVERVEASGAKYSVVNQDAIVEAAQMPADSVGLIVTSIPFATQYEYTPSFNDLGHTDDNEHFWEQMDFLIPSLLRVLQPGRVAAIHVKDRITPGGVNGLGFQTVTPFSDECVAAFTKHGFAFLSRKTVVTDVVRENNQTYRLGWTEQCKDGSRMGNGMPEYVLMFRKPPSDPANGYADLPVRKDKATFTRARWQFDAHGFHRSSGDRPLTPAELEGLDQAAIFKLFRKHSLSNVYDFRHDVRIAEHVADSGWLPSTFMLLQPQSWHDDVWTDIARMRTLNATQAAKGREMHLCPLQFDIVDRCIEQYSMPGEVVFDPFGGIGTVPFCAIKLGRRGAATELNPRYFLDMAAYCAAAEREQSMPGLFDTLEDAA